MQKKLLWGALVVFLGVLAYTFLGNETQQISQIYQQKLNEERKQKDVFFRESSQSPLEDKSQFGGLQYFAPDSTYRVLATIISYEGADVKTTVKLTNGETETYEKLGYAQFALNNATYQLLVYAHDQGLSVLFKDATTPSETYGGGRYLDFKTSDIQNQKLWIDFNNAYNPYCAYNTNYACPIPPAENTLPVRIEAGEKNYK